MAIAVLSMAIVVTAQHIAVQAASLAIVRQLRLLWLRVPALLLQLLYLATSQS